MERGDTESFSPLSINVYLVHEEGKGGVLFDPKVAWKLSR